MKWWKRGLFSVISLIGGFFSLDYQMLAFRLLTQQGTQENTNITAGLLWQLAGAGMFFLYAAALIGYLYLVRKGAAFFPEWQEGDKKKTWKGPRLEMIFQSCVLLTGLILRLGYILYIYLPERFA